MGKNITKIIALILTGIIFFTALINANVIAYASEKEEVITETNYIYDDIIDKELSLSLLNNNSKQSNTCNIQAYNSTKNAIAYEDTNSAATYLRDAMVNREPTVTLSIKSKSTDFSDLVHEIFNKSYSQDLSVGNSDGDYLKWTWASFQASGSQTTYSSYYEYTINYTIGYYTTLDEEKQVTEIIQNAANELELNKLSDYDKIASIHNYTCDTIKYDYEHSSDSTYKYQFTAYAALVNKTAVCQGYSMVFYRLCKEADLQCRVITSSNHAWNIVKLGEYYYDVDCTWDDSKHDNMGDSNGNYWSGIIDHVYFLKSDNDFPGHIKESEYTTDDFISKYPISPKSYYNYLITGYATHQALCPVCDEVEIDSEPCTFENGVCIYCGQPEERNITGQIVIMEQVNDIHNNNFGLKNVNVIINDEIMATTDENGMFSLSLTPGNYTATLSYEYGYDRNITINIPNSDSDIANLEPIAMVVCNYIKDESINVKDTKVFDNGFDKYNKIFDLNNDGIINYYDAYIYDNFLRFGKLTDSIYKKNA